MSKQHKASRGRCRPALWWSSAFVCVEQPKVRTRRFRSGCWGASASGRVCALRRLDAVPGGAATLAPRSAGATAVHRE